MLWICLLFAEERERSGQADKQYEQGCSADELRQITAPPQHTKRGTRSKVPPYMACLHDHGKSGVKLLRKVSRKPSSQKDLQSWVRERNKLFNIYLILVNKHLVIRKAGIFLLFEMTI